MTFLARATKPSVITQYHYWTITGIITQYNYRDN